MKVNDTAATSVHASAQQKEREAPQENRPALRHALVTGASQGLGMAFADECAARGMDLFPVALPESGLPQVAQRMASEWEVKVVWLDTDLSRVDAPDRLLASLERSGFEPDLLVNKAGIGSIGPFAESSLSNFEATIHLNVLALVRLTRRLVPELLRPKAAHILNVANLGSFFPMPYLPIYSATKTFVLTFTLALREGPKGRIRVGALCHFEERCPFGLLEYFIMVARKT